MSFPDSVSIVKEHTNQIIEIENRFAKAKISLFGAQIFSFIPLRDGRERMWLSPLTNTDGSETIRGGTPVCWPWFANQFPNNDTSLPAHGFVRNQNWDIAAINEIESGTQIILQCPNTRDNGFEYSAELRLEILVGEKLELTLNTKNTDNKPFKFTGALHTYFAIENIHNIQINGLDGEYLDKTRDMQRFSVPDNYSINEVTDRIHFSSKSELELAEGSNSTEIGANGHDSVVIWNPWQEEVKNVANIPDEDYQKFICIEAAVTQGVSLEPQESHTLQQIIG